MKQFRHGDVFLQEVATPDRKGRKYRNDNLVAEGEATGHAHRATGDYLLYELDGSLYLKARSQTALVHEEHARIALPKGTFRVVLQREWTADRKWFIHRCLCGHAPRLFRRTRHCAERGLDLVEEASSDQDMELLSVRSNGGRCSTPCRRSSPVEFTGRPGSAFHRGARDRMEGWNAKLLAAAENGGSALL